MPSRVLGGNSPIKISLPTATNFLISPKVFESTCFMHIPTQHRDRLNPKAVCILVGYPSTQKGYKCYLVKNRKILVTMDSTIQDTYYSS